MNEQPLAIAVTATRAVAIRVAVVALCALTLTTFLISETTVHFNACAAPVAVDRRRVLPDGGGRGRLFRSITLSLLMMCGAMAPPKQAAAQTLPASPAAGAQVNAPLDAAVLAQAASPDSVTRIAAVVTLAQTESLAALNLLVVILQRDIDPAVRRAAAIALGRSRNADMHQPLEYAAQFDWDPGVRAAAAAADQAVIPFGRRARVAAGLSLICPGCGYFYLRQPGRAATYLGAVAALIAVGYAVQSHTAVDAAGNHGDGRAMPVYMAAQNLWFYGIFATYRDARLARGDADARYPVAREELPELLAAPFTPSVLKSPYVWAGVPAMVGAAIGFGYLVSQFGWSSDSPNMRSLGDPGGVRFFGHKFDTASGVALGEGYNLSLMLPVAVGEEALFRGVVQAGLSETSLGLWGGWAVGSLIFGGIHVFNFLENDADVKVASVAVPYLILTGSYLGYVYIRQNFSLLTGTAIHFWYDFALSTLDFIADPDGQPFVARFAVPF